MKRLLAIVLVFMLAVSLLPAAAFADEGGISVGVGGKYFTDANQTIKIGGGTATLTRDFNTIYTLTLNNVNLTSFTELFTDNGVTAYAGIAIITYGSYYQSFTIKFVGNNSITAPKHGSNAIYEGIFCNGQLAISGDNITVNGVDIGIEQYKEYSTNDFCVVTKNLTVNASDTALVCTEVRFGGETVNLNSTGKACIVGSKEINSNAGTTLNLNLTPDISRGYETCAAIICDGGCTLSGKTNIAVDYNASGYRSQEEITAFGIYVDGVSCANTNVTVNLTGGSKCSAVGICADTLNLLPGKTVNVKVNIKGSHNESCAILAGSSLGISSLGDATVCGANENDSAIECFGDFQIRTGNFYAYTDCVNSNVGAFYCEGTGDRSLIAEEIVYPSHAALAKVDDEYDAYIVVDVQGKPADKVVFSSKGYPFRDIDGSNTAPFKDAILWAVDKGITTGFTPVEFRPSAQCTRGQVVTFLWRAKGCPEPTITENPFVDVASTSPYYKAILWAYENGITTGIDDTHFKPSNPCTRGQVVTFLWRADGTPAPQSDENPFKDVSKTGKTAPFYEAILWAAENSITTGYSDNTFRPAATCTRGQIVTFIYRDMNE